MIKNIFSEFKKFAIRGNVMDMAVGIIIGAAFTKIVDSLVKDILMPPLGFLMGKIDFANLFFVLKNGNPEAPYASIDAAKSAGAVTLNVGFFINAIISFVIVAFAVFILIKIMNTLREKLDRKEEEEKIAEEKAEPSTKKCPYCDTEISIKAVKCPHCTSDLEERK